MKILKTMLMALSIGALLNTPAWAQPEDEGFIEGDVYPEDEAAHPAEDADISYFFDKLASYGEWIWTPEHGWVWQPRGVWEDWRPYTYGRWAYTDYGWTWSSYFHWGWAPFHYGSWAFLDHLGWIWVPGTVWAPAWVMWRYSDGYVGWSPILAGYGYWYGWAYYPVYYHHWTFINWRHFCDPHPHHHYLPRGRVYDAFRHTYYPRRCRNRSGADCQRGPSRKVVSARTNTPVKTYRVKNVVPRSHARHAAKMPLGVERDTLKIHRPRFKPGPQRMELSKKTPRIRRSKDLGPIQSAPRATIERRPQNQPAPSRADQPDRIFKRERPFPGKAIHPPQPKIRRPSFSRPAINHSGPKIRTNRNRPPVKTNRPGPTTRSTPQVRPAPRTRSTPKVRPAPRTRSTPRMRSTPKMRSRSRSSSSRRSSSGSRSRSSSRRSSRRR